MALHVNREANKVVAHRLARFALFNNDSIWIEETPDCIVDLQAPEFRAI